MKKLVRFIAIIFVIFSMLIPVYAANSAATSFIDVKPEQWF